MAVRPTVAAPSSLRRLFCSASTSTSTCTSTFIPPPAMGVDPPREEAGPSTSLFVTGLSKLTNTVRLREAFSQFGKVVHARVMIDRISGYSKGFGFVKYTTVEEAAKGIEGMDGKFLDGWVIFTEYARQIRQRQPGNHEAQTRAGHDSNTHWNARRRRPPGQPLNHEAWTRTGRGSNTRWNARWRQPPGQLVNHEAWTRPGYCSKTRWNTGQRRPSGQPVNHEARTPAGHGSNMRWNTRQR